MQEMGVKNRKRSHAYPLKQWHCHGFTFGLFSHCTSIGNFGELVSLHTNILEPLAPKLGSWPRSSLGSATATTTPSSPPPWGHIANLIVQKLPKPVKQSGRSRQRFSLVISERNTKHMDQTTVILLISWQHGSCYDAMNKRSLQSYCF